MKIALYPGTFDPITKGHMDIILRASKLVDKLVIGVAPNEGKAPLFSLKERINLVKAEVKASGITGQSGVPIEVVGFNTLLIHFAEEIGATMIIRGLRAVTDFDYEFQMTGINALLNSEIETVFLMASDHYQFISSRFIKEICRLEGAIDKFVSPGVVAALHQKFAR